MKVRILLIIGGALLVLYGGVFLINNFNTIKSIDPDGPLISFNARGMFKTGMILLPLGLAFAGLLGFLAGFLNRNSILSWTTFIGLRLAILPALLLAAAVICNPAVLAPYYQRLISWLGLSIDINRLYLLSVCALAACIQIYQAGINIAEYGTIDAYVISLAVSRAVFILGFLPSFYLHGLPETISNILPFKVPENHIPSLAFAALYGYFIWIFILIKARAKNRTAVSVALLTLACVPVFVAYYALVQAFYGIGIIRIVLGWTFLIPLAAIGFLMKPLGYKINYSTKRIGHSICEWCRNEFYGLYRFCGTECREEAEKPVFVQCATCSKPFTVTNLEARGGVRYCSPACVPRPVYACGKCGREISGRYTRCSYCGTYNN